MGCGGSSSAQTAPVKQEEPKAPEPAPVAVEQTEPPVIAAVASEPEEIVKAAPAPAPEVVVVIKEEQQQAPEKKPAKANARKGVTPIMPIQPAAKKPMSRIIFDKYDKDASGSIDISEFRFLCVDMGHQLTDAQIEMAIKLLDTAGKGHILYDPFQKWWATDERFSKLQLKDDQLSTLHLLSEEFQQYDSDDSGSIDRNEFSKLYLSLKERGHTDKSLEDCITDLDTNKDGMIVFNEYVDWLIRTNALKVKVISLAGASA